MRREKILDKNNAVRYIPGEGSAPLGLPERRERTEGEGNCIKKEEDHGAREA
jgi:hypothetical protein